MNLSNTKSIVSLVSVNRINYVQKHYQTFYIYLKHGNCITLSEIGSWKLRDTRGFPNPDYVPKLNILDLVNNKNNDAIVEIDYDNKTITRVL